MEERLSPASLVAGMTAEERELMAATVDVYDRIRALGLRTNESELAHATHTVQMFVINRVLHRQWPDHWSNWFYGRLSPRRIAAGLRVGVTRRRRRWRRSQPWRRNPRASGGGRRLATLAPYAALALALALIVLFARRGARASSGRDPAARCPQPRR